MGRYIRKKRVHKTREERRGIEAKRGREREKNQENNRYAKRDDAKQND
jgi:hypothetical protein